MIGILSLTILAMLLIFVQSVLNALGSFSLLIIVSLLIYDRNRLLAYLGVVLPVTLVNDVYFSYPIGFTFLFIVIATLIYRLSKQFLPVNNLIVEGVIIFFVFMLYHIMQFVGVELVDSARFVSGWEQVWLSVRFSLIETLIYFALKAGLSKITLGSSSSGIKV